ncbi:MAG: hypothetical protein SW833_23080 [Cyanobacteriota bacterium]|nr:hypothetical protein [Cyanobacteriota bacterium]
MEFWDGKSRRVAKAIEGCDRFRYYRLNLPRTSPIYSLSLLILILVLEAFAEPVYSRD